MVWKYLAVILIVSSSLQTLRYWEFINNRVKRAEASLQTSYECQQFRYKDSLVIARLPYYSFDRSAQFVR